MIIVTELSYQVNKVTLVERIALPVDEKELYGVADHSGRYVGSSLKEGDGKYVGGRHVGAHLADGDKRAPGDQGRQRRSMLLAVDPPDPRRAVGGTLQRGLLLGIERNIAWWDWRVPLSPFPSTWSPETPPASSYE